MTEECRQDYLLPTHIANVPSRTTYASTGAEKQALNATPKYVREVTPVISDVNMVVHEHANTIHGPKDQLLAQNRDVHISAIRELVAKESIGRNNS